MVRADTTSFQRQSRFNIGIYIETWRYQGNEQPGMLRGRNKPILLADDAGILGLCTPGMRRRRS